MNKFILIDGFALIFRAYYAFIRRPMINSKGIDMSAIFGFTKTLIELLLKEKPTHIAVGLDPGGKTFRHEIFPQYKANREETPKVIKDSIPIIFNILKAFNIPICMVPGYEADDVLGTVAREAEQMGHHVWLVTSDKDYGQLVSSNIMQYKPGRSGDEWELLGVKEICEKYSIDTPEQVVDILAIQGDISDNVPGVPGIGEVGAKKLIAIYKSVENLLAHLDELPERQRNSILENRGQLLQAKELITINTSVPFSWSEDECKVEATDMEMVETLLKEYEFYSLRSSIPPLKHLFCPQCTAEAITAQPPLLSKTIHSPESVRSSQITNTLQPTCASSFLFRISEEELPDFNSSPPLISISPLFSPNSFVQKELRALAICVNHKEVHWFPCSTSNQQQRIFLLLKPWLESPEIALAGHNLKPLLRLFFHHGISVAGDIWDVELMHYLLNPERSHKIELLAQSILQFDFPHAETAAPQQASLFDSVELHDAFSEGEKHELCATSIASMSLYPILFKQLQVERMDKLYVEIEMPLINVLAQMEINGVNLDIPRLRLYGAECRQELNSITKQIRQLCEDPQLNIASPKQLGTLLFEKLKIDPKAKLTSGKQYATDEETLLSLKERHAVIPLILDYRSVSKILSTYIEPLPAMINPNTGRIHTTFNQSLTATGRLSSQKPNMQNIPIREERGKELRKLFIPRSKEYLLLSADYSQIELRIMAHLSQDPHFIEAFKNGEDIHLSTAAKIFHCTPQEVTREQRNRAKTANFGIIYGISSFGLSQRLHIPRDESKALIEEYFNTYPKVKEYIEKQVITAKKTGYVSTLLQRRRYLPDIHAQNGAIRNLAERNAVNAPIQGSAADIIKIAMVRIAHKMAQKKLQSKMILQVHDELVFDLNKPEKEELIDMVKTEMEQSVSLDVPLVADCGVGEHWLEAH